MKDKNTELSKTNTKLGRRCRRLFIFRFFHRLLAFPTPFLKKENNSQLVWCELYVFLTNMVGKAGGFSSHDSSPDYSPPPLHS